MWLRMVSHHRQPRTANQFADPSDTVMSESFSLVPDFESSLSDLQLPCYIVPLRQKPPFFGREATLKQLDEALLQPTAEVGSDSTTERPKAITLCGPGGMGKTRIAAEFVHTRRNNFDAVFWVPADQFATIFEAYSKIATELGLIQVNSSDAKNPVVVREVVKGWLSNPIKSYKSREKARWLIVFDNAHTMDMKADIDDYLPLDGPGSVLVTSRDIIAPDCSESIAVEPFNQQEATAFLVELTRRAANSEEEMNCRRVAKRLGGLPMAMTQMAEIINRRDLSFAEFLSAYDEKESRKHLLEFDMHTQWSLSPGHKYTLASVWELENLTRRSRALLDILSFLDPDDIPERILTPLPPSESISGDLAPIPGYPVSPTDYQLARTELLQSSLISRYRLANKISTHCVIQDVVRTMMDPEQLRSSFAMCLRLLSQVWPFQTCGWHHELAGWAACGELFPHVISIFRLSKDVENDTGDDALACYQLAKLLIDAGW